MTDDEKVVPLRLQAHSVNGQDFALAGQESGRCHGRGGQDIGQDCHRKLASMSEYPLERISSFGVAGSQSGYPNQLRTQAPPSASDDAAKTMNGVREGPPETSSRDDGHPPDQPGDHQRSDRTSGSPPGRPTDVPRPSEHRPGRGGVLTRTRAALLHVSYGHADFDLVQDAAEGSGLTASGFLAAAGLALAGARLPPPTSADRTLLREVVELRSVLAECTAALKHETAVSGPIATLTARLSAVRNCVRATDHVDELTVHLIQRCVDG